LLFVLPAKRLKINVVTDVAGFPDLSSHLALGRQVFEGALSFMGKSIPSKTAKNRLTEG
jgi:hypothetical protein